MGKVISDKDLELLLDRSDLLGKSRRLPTSCCSNTWLTPGGNGCMYVVLMCAALHFSNHISNPPAPDKGKGTKSTAKVGVFRVVDTQESSDITLS